MYDLQNVPNSAFWGWLSMESQPQNPEFRNNLGNSHPCKYAIQNYKLTLQKKYGVQNMANSAFWGWLSMESQPQNPEFRNNLENFHPWKYGIQNYKQTFWRKYD